MLGAPSTTPACCLGGRPAQEAGHPRVYHEGICSYSHISHLNPSKLAETGLEGRGYRSIDLAVLWSPPGPDPLLPSVSKQAPARGPEKLPAACIQPIVSSSFHILEGHLSRNAFDHLNPGCINSPNPFNSKGFFSDVPSLAPWSTLLPLQAEER